MRAPSSTAAPGERRIVSDVSVERGATDGQVLIEVLLILPVFMLLIFMIMQIGFFSFQAIVTHHGAYEVARIASLTAEKSGCTSCWTVSQVKAQAAADKMFKDATVKVKEMPTGNDFQESCLHCDVEVRMTRRIPVHLPMINVFMSKVSDNCDSKGCLVTAVVRMPIERPLEK